MRYKLLFLAPTHPWNLIKQNRETVSFVVFVYAVGLGLILIRLCSFLTFMGIAAGFHTTYTLGGPYLCFRGQVIVSVFFSLNASTSVN